MWTSFTPAVQTALDLARQYAAQEESPAVEPLHVLLSLSMLTPEQAPELHALLQAHETRAAELRLYTEAALSEPHRRSRREPQLSAGVKQALTLAAESAQRDAQADVGPEYVLLGLARVNHGLHYQAVLLPLGLTSRPLRRTIESIGQQQRPYREGNPLNDLDDDSRGAVDRAHNLMRLSFCGRIDTPHLLLALLDEEELADICSAAEINVDQLRGALNAGLANDGEIAMPQQRFTENAKRCLHWAAGYAHEEAAAQITPRHLLHALLPQDLHSREIHEQEAGQNLIARCLTVEQVTALEAQLLPQTQPEETAATARDEALSVPPHQQWVRLEWPYFVLGLAWGPVGYVALRLHWDWVWWGIVSWWGLVVLACATVTLDSSLRRWYHTFGSVLTGCLTGVAAFLSCMACFGAPK